MSRPESHANRFLALGDSYTVGEGLDLADSWPHQLCRRLAERGIEMLPPRIIARTGWATDELAEAIRAANLEHTFDLVSLSVGVNNQYRGRSVMAFRNELAGLLEKSIALADSRPGRVLVPSIPDWSRSPFAQKLDRNQRQTSRQIARFNRALKTSAVAAGCRWLNITPTTRSPNPEDYASDGLHPSAAVYARWVELMIDPVTQMLAPRCPA